MDGLAISILFLVVLSFLLFLIRVGLIFYHNILLARELKRLTREAEARRCDNTVIATTDNQSNQPPKDDLPPAYDEIVQTKLALQASAEEGRGTNVNASMSIPLSTLANASSSNAARIYEEHETLPPAYENAVFEHDDAIINGHANRNLQN